MKHEDIIYSRTHIHFGFLDRIKILLGYRVTFESDTYTEFLPGETEAKTKIRVYRNRKIPKQGFGFAEAVALLQVEGEGK